MGTAGRHTQVSRVGTDTNSVTGRHTSGHRLAWDECGAPPPWQGPSGQGLPPGPCLGPSENKAPNSGPFKGRAKKCVLQGSLHLAEPAPRKVPGSSEAHPGSEGRVGRQPACGGDGSGQDSSVGLRCVASWGPAVALASVSPPVQGSLGLQADSAALSTDLRPPWWVGPPGEMAVEDRDGKRVGSVSGTAHCPPPPHPRQAFRRPGAHAACRALDADAGIQPPLFSPLCVLNK